MPSSTVLIVDDDPEILAFYRKIFENAPGADFDILGEESPVEAASIKVRTFSDPLEFLKDYEGVRKSGVRHPLCILDMRMPILNGLATALRLREIDPDIDIIICTAFSDVPVDEIRSKLHGGAFFVRKPFVAEEFSLLVHSLVGYWNTRQSLRQRTLLLTSLLESISDLVFMKDTHGVYIDCNRAFCRFVGRTREQIIGHTDHDLFASDVADAFREADRTMLEQGQPRGNEELITYPDGSKFFVETLKSPIRSESGENLGVIGVSRDITSRKEREEELRQARIAAERANAAKSTFLAIMSHEIRTPLNGIIGIADILSHTNLDKEQSDHLHLLAQSGHSLLTLVNHILDFSKIEAGELKLEERPFDPAAELGSCAKLFTHAVQSKGVDLHIDLAPMPRALVGDSLRLRQIVSNILSNAVKFTLAGKIQLKAAASQQDDGRWRLDVAVSDTGIGIPASALPQLFVPFHQVDTSTTRKFGGSGLGLSIIKRLLEAMGGEISVESSPRGTTFSFYVVLPEALHAPTPQDTSPERFAAACAPGTMEILLAEDNSVNQVVAISLLKRLGRTAHVAENGRKAVDMIAAGNYDLVFMDLQMPEMGGLEATEAVRKLPLQKQPRIIALTANAFEDDRDKCLAAGMDGFISKPFGLESLSREIAETSRPRGG